MLACGLCIATITGHTQIFCGNNYGFNVGAISALGNRFQRIGFTLQCYYYHDFAQINAEARIYHSFKNLGPRKRYNELVASAGVVAGYGAKQVEHNPFVSVVSNQTHYSNSVGYSYNLYFNKIGTTQQTGIISVQLDKFSIISENDIFARPELDRFRTGALLLQYQYKNMYQFAINCTMWTGQMGNKVSDDKAFPFHCYLDTVGGVYTNFSHGLLSGQFKMALNYGQTLQGNLGMDAEQVRNFIQNRLVHNIHKSKNCHIPMLDTAGNQYLYRAGQKIRAPKPYWNVFTSAGIFY